MSSHRATIISDLPQQVALAQRAHARAAQIVAELEAEPDMRPEVRALVLQHALAAHIAKHHVDPDIGVAAVLRTISFAVEMWVHKLGPEAASTAAPIAARKRRAN